MRKFVVVTGVVAVSLAGLFVIAGRGTQEFKGFAKASADVATEGVTESLPEEVHDRKIDQELKQVRLDLVDRQIQMNLSSRKIEELSAEVTRLAGSTERRQRLLGEAYPILKAAIDSMQSMVRWANQEFALAEFQKEIDDLLAMQDRETHQLGIKRDGLARLKKSVEEGELAMAEMKRGLDDTEQKVALLKTRREQAEVESQTLDLVSSATTNADTVAASLSKSVDRLKDNVDKTEARNAARRTSTSLGERTSSNNVSRAFNRLESLKAIHDATAKPAETAETAIQNQFRDALRVGAGRQRILSSIAAEARRKQQYFEERYDAKFVDFMAMLDRWDASGTVEQKLAAQVLRFRYVTGESWARIAEQFGIADRECKPQRELAKREFAGR